MYIDTHYLIATMLYGFVANKMIVGVIIQTERVGQCVSGIDGRGLSRSVEKILLSNA